VLGERGIVLRSLREGIDTSNASGRMVAGVLASLAELELELGKERRTAARDARRARGQSIGRPKALDPSKVVLAQRMHTSGESASTIAATLGVSRAAVQRLPTTSRRRPHPSLGPRAFAPRSNAEHSRFVAAAPSTGAGTPKQSHSITHHARPAAATSGQIARSESGSSLRLRSKVWRPPT
jgi:hypothetical protein